MNKIRDVLQRTNYVVIAATLALAGTVPLIVAKRTSALGLLDRSLMVSSTNASDDTTAPDGSTYIFDGTHVVAGDGRNGQKVTHTYTFTVPTAGTIKGFTIEYCQSAFAYVGVGVTGCATPGGFTATNWDGANAVVGHGTNTNFAVGDNGVANYLTLKDSTGFTATANQVITITFTATETNYFTNPNTAYITDVNAHGTYFAHIATFNSDSDATASFTDNSGPINGLVDEGTVTNNVTKSISIYTRVQETLNFSVEGDDDLSGQPGTTGTPNTYGGSGACVPLGTAGTSATVHMGDANYALDATLAYFAKSYFRLATNASGGTQVYYVGDTLRSGANTITAIGGGSAVASNPGTEQFGLAFDNTSNGSSNEVRSGGGSALTAETGYGSNAAGYAFVASTSTPTLLAHSTSVVPCDTGAVQYVANIGTNTEAGIYTTKINYIAAPKY